MALENKIINKKQFVIEGISSVCALLSSIIALIMVLFKKWISISLLQSETVTAFELSDIIGSYRRMIESFNLVNPDDIEKNFGDLDIMSTVFVALSIVIAVALIVHMVFLIFGKGKWVRSTIILPSVLYLVLLISFNMFAETVNEAVAEIGFGFISFSNVLSVESSAYYTLIPLGIGILSSFIYAYYKKKN